MAQGAIKKPSTTTSSSRNNNNNKKPTPGPKHGNRIIKPKKASAVSARKIQKKHAAGLAAQTEKYLAAKAGHLEMLRGGKRDLKKGGRGERG